MNNAAALVKRVLKEIAIALTGGLLLLAGIIAVQGLSAREAWLGKKVPIVIGSTLKLPLSGRPTLLIAISASCRYSLRSLAFERTLVIDAHNHGINVLVFTPNDPSAQLAEKSLGVSAQAVAIKDLRSYGIFGTPWMALVSADDHVLHIWSGQLPTHSQGVVYDQISTQLNIVSEPDLSGVALEGSTSTSQPGPSAISGAANDGKVVANLDNSQLLQLMRHRETLDISERSSFKYFGRPGATNIPADEVEARMPHELDRTAAMLLDCSHVPSGDCDIVSYILEKAGFANLLVINRGAEGLSCQTTPTD